MSELDGSTSIVVRLRWIGKSLREHAADVDGIGGCSAEDCGDEASRLADGLGDLVDEIETLAVELGGPPPSGPIQSGLDKAARVCGPRGFRAPPWMKGQGRR